MKKLIVVSLCLCTSFAFGKPQKLVDAQDEMGEEINNRTDACGGRAYVYIFENDDTSLYVSVICGMVMNNELDEYLGTVMDVVDTILRKYRIRVKEVRMEQNSNFTWHTSPRNIRRVRKIKDPVKKSRFLRKRKKLTRSFHE
jgi:hypothetical protein